MRLNERMKRIGRRKWRMLGAFPQSLVMLEVDWDQLLYISLCIWTHLPFCEAGVMGLRGV
jgi:hypothetical protein